MRYYIDFSRLGLFAVPIVFVDAALLGEGGTIANGNTRTMRVVSASVKCGYQKPGGQQGSMPYALEITNGIDTFFDGATVGTGNGGGFKTVATDKTVLCGAEIVLPTSSFQIRVTVYDQNTGYASGVDNLDLQGTLILEDV